MPLALHNGEEPINNNEFDEFATAIGSTPPEHFKIFYIENNGGVLDDSNTESNIFLLNSFLSIKYGEATIESTYKQLINGEPDLVKLIPFAYDDCGNLFVISTREKDYGKIYLWLTDEKELDLLSNSFEIFLADIAQ